MDEKRSLEDHLSGKPEEKTSASVATSQLSFFNVKQEISRKFATGQMSPVKQRKRETCYVAPYIATDKEQRLTESGSKKDLKTGMIVTGYKSSERPELSLEVSQSIEKIRNQDQELMTSLQRCNNGHDREVEKLTKELKDANNILANLEQNIELLKAKKELNQQELLIIKGEYKLLLQEKFNCEKQISLIRKDFDRIKDKRVLRDFDQLGICYEKLCQKERATRKQISLLEAELSMIVSKIDVPKSKRSAGQVVPKLELDKLKNNGNKGLPPVKNPPKAPRRGNTIYPKQEVLTEFSGTKTKAGKNRYLKRNTAPQHSHGLKQTSSSAPFLKGMVPRFTGEPEDISYLPLLGNQKQLAARPQREVKGDNFEHTDDVKFPHITDSKEKKPVKLISENLPVEQVRQPKRKGFLPHVQNRKSNNRVASYSGKHES